MGEPGHPVGAGELWEREFELGLVGGLLDAASGGAGTVVVVEGVAGIGKSALLAAVGEGAQACGFGVLFARGSEFEGEIAFGVARQVFEPMLRAASPGELQRLLGGVARVGAQALGIEAGEPAVDRFAAVHGLFWLLANRAERQRLVVVVDDVQWSDDPSLAWLGYLARQTGDLAVLLVLGLRSGDPGGERSELEQLLSDDGVRRIGLGPLTAAGVDAIVRAQLDQDADEAFCTACGELTGGNPLFVRELLAAARDERLLARSESVPALQRIAPAAVGTSVLARLGRMGADATALARAVAVLGAGTEVVLAAQLAELDLVVAELTADRLAAAQILAPVRPLEFFHPVIGAAVREDIAPGARRVAHRRAAELLDREGEGSLAQVAAHLLACGPAGDRWVVQRLRDAACEALDRGAPDVAGSYLRRVLSEPPAVGERAAGLFLLGTAEWRVGQPDAIAHLEQALAAADSDPRTLIASGVALALALAASDRAESAVEVLEQSIASVGDRTATLAPTDRLGTIEPEALRDVGLALTLEAGAVLAGMSNERTAPAALRRADALWGRLTTVTDPSVYMLVTLAYHAARTNLGAEAQKLVERALERDPYGPARQISNIVLATLTLIECYDELQRVCENLEAAARRHAASHELAMISVFRSSASCDRGELTDAEADARWALERAAPAHRIHAVSALIRVLIERDALEQAEDMLEQVADPGGSRSDELIRFLMARGQLRSAQRRVEAALDDFLECGQRCARLGRVTVGAAPWRAEAALAHAALGDAQEARRLAVEQLELARAFGRPRALGISLRASGRECGRNRVRLIERIPHAYDYATQDRSRRR
jgi:tetratricopeptide (TPR) repeat protein